MMLRAGISVCLTAFALAMPARAAEAPAACLVPAADIDTAAAALAAEGWSPVPEGDLSEEAAERLLWLYVAQYTTGDTGGEALMSLVELQRRTVAGLARKRDISTSRQRLMMQDGAALILQWREPVPGLFELQCRIARDEGSASAGFLRAPDEAVPFGRVSVIRLDRDGLAAQTGADVPGTLIETYLTYPADATQ